MNTVRLIDNVRVMCAIAHFAAEKSKIKIIYRRITWRSVYLSISNVRR